MRLIIIPLSISCFVSETSAGTLDEKRNLSGRVCEAGSLIGAGRYILVERGFFLGMGENMHELPWFERGMLPALSGQSHELIASSPGHLSSWAEYYMSQFYISDCAGRGANGEVWRGVTAGDAKPIRVVLKRIFSKKNPKSLASSMREVYYGEMIGSKHSNLSRFISHFVENGELWLVFRDEGISLYQAIFEPVLAGRSMIMTQSLFWRELRLKPYLFLSTMKQVLEGLSTLHAMNITHRDIKLENILIDPISLHVRIGDFGSAIHFPVREESYALFPPNGPTEDEETQRYSPPEKWTKERSHSLDMWCVGVMWLEMFLGSVDLGLEDRREGICVRDQHCDIEKLKARIKHRDPLGIGMEYSGMIDLVSKLLSFDPSARPSAIEALNHPVFRATSVSSAVQHWSKPSAKLSVILDSAESQGGRGSMEDRLVAGWFGRDKIQYIACVMDGHNGETVSGLLSDTLKKYMREISLEDSNPQRALDQIVSLLLKKVAKEETKLDSMTGSTLCCALVTSKGVWVANIGDSRLIVVEKIDEMQWKPEIGGRVLTATGALGKIKEFRNGLPLVQLEGSDRLTVGKSVRPAGSAVRAIQISQDHKPDLPAEKEYIEGNGGTVVFSGGSTARVNGILAISRSVGVRALRPAVRNSPDIFSYPLSGKSIKLVIATDGVWDVLSVQEVAELETAHDVVDQASASGGRDNMAVIVLEIDARDS